MKNFENLAYFGIFSEDTVRMMMEGKLPLYEELRDKLLVQCAFVALDPNTGAILAMVEDGPIMQINLIALPRPTSARQCFQTICLHYCHR
ncbi:MAG: hypothetical protein CM1200mP10_32050 [Candidatus Neomarinimicrobiota bacterium]|nr:MAG: hypothetical protein CM1200mP10_32050 [Candidatus Neomarinimicrobiota bacterium]